MILNAKMKTFSALFGAAVLVSACAQTVETSSSSSSSSATTTTSTPAFADPADTQFLAENVGDRVFFETDRASLDYSARITLDGQADWLKQNASINLIIEGHADERGTREYNIALGARRANAMRDYLVGKGVSSARLQTISYGKERPVSLCSEEMCWSKNRRSVATVR